MNIFSISKYFVLFMIYSCAGWLIETTWVSIKSKKIVDRGFFIGPYCPIYGFGALFIILFLNRFSINPVLLFITTIFVCGILEYCTSWYMEKIFKARWWDYSDRKVNINGRVCLSNLIAFGLMGIAVTYIINPIFIGWLNNLKENEINDLAIILAIIMIADFIISTIVIYGFRAIAEKVNKEQTTDNTEQITKMVREKFSQISFLHRRILSAYPRVEAIKLKMKEIKTKIEDVVTEKTEEIRNNIRKGK